jgi:dTDP-4-amino-4,6-dideoxygalactose transaminase
VYDAAHAFGASFHGRALAAWGDVATLSFHATKLFHTVEGGAVVTNDDAIARSVAALRNFGHDGYEAFGGIGTNGKNSEVHAAMGLCLLPRVPGFVAERAAITQRYDAAFASVGALVSRPALRAGLDYNFAYHAVLLESEAAVRAVQQACEARRIRTRRYFYPLLNGALSYVRTTHTPVAHDVARRVLCLPLFTGMTNEQVDRVASAVLDGLNAIG